MKKHIKKIVSVVFIFMVLICFNNNIYGQTKEDKSFDDTVKLEIQKELYNIGEMVVLIDKDELKENTFYKLPLDNKQEGAGFYIEDGRVHIKVMSYKGYEKRRDRLMVEVLDEQNHTIINENLNKDNYECINFVYTDDLNYMLICTQDRKEKPYNPVKWLKSGILIKFM